MKKIGILALSFGLFFLVGCTQQEPVENQENLQAKITESADVLSFVAEHSDESSCWTFISGSVYDLTSFIGKHPGGDQAILASCGKDATEMFDEKHGMDPKKWEGLEKFRVLLD